MKQRVLVTMAVLLAIPLGGGLLLWGMCWPADVSGDPTLTGGYHVGTVYKLQQPGDLYGDWLSRIPARMHGCDIPVGTRVRVTQILYSKQIRADNQPRIDIYGQFLDGPAAGQAVNLGGFSKIKWSSTGPRITALDPELLKPEP